MTKRIDINCDLGEGSGNDREVMPYISSCSIACGGHFGTRETIVQTLQYAEENDVKVGAHPAYPDPENFGRISMKIHPHDLQDSLRKQLDLFYSLCSSVHHIKPHGALYNDLFSDIDKAHAVVDVFKEYTPVTKVYCAPKSALAKVAEKAGFIIVFEGFGDRAYDMNGQLVSRKIQGAVYDDAARISDQVLGLVLEQKVIPFSGEPIPLAVQTICMHGDNKHVVRNLKHLNNRLKAHKINVQSL